MKEDKIIKILLPELPGNLKNLASEEDKIKLQSLTLIKSDTIFDERLDAYENSMSAVHSLTKEHKNRTDDELTIQYIGIRLFNDLAVSLRLMLSGYYQMSFAIQRDMIEIAFLLDYLRSFPTKTIEWKNSSNDERIANFSPRVIRNALDKRDNVTNQRRAKRYKLFCEYATHVSYPGNKLVAPGPKRLGKIGPFYDEKFLRGCFFELIENGYYAVLLFMGCFKDIKDKGMLRIRVDFLKQLSGWYQERFKQKLTVDLEEIDKLLDKLF